MLINDAQLAPNLMVLSQLRDISEASAAGGDATLCIRCNYGVGIMASQFGCEVNAASECSGCP